MRLEKKENLKMEEKSEIWIEMLPASQGDCILVTMPDADIRILIDGGIGDTYKDSLKERLLQLNSENKAIDLLVVTHIDNDHIGGIVELLKENGSDSESKIIKIENIWHNSYRHLQFDRALQTGKAEEQILKKVIAKGAVQEKQEKKSGRREISALQGTTLAAMILQGGYCWNSQFGGMAVSSQTGKIYLGQCCAIRVLLPGRKELEMLAKEWRYQLKRSRFSFQFSENELFDDAFEYYYRYLSGQTKGERKQTAAEKRDAATGKTIEELAGYQAVADSSKANLSSISFLLEYRGKKILFLADNIAENALKMADGETYFDAVKLPHHGSVKNTSDAFLTQCITERYLISTNSMKHGHPDLETLAKIINKDTDFKKRIFFNYKAEKVKDFEKRVGRIKNTQFVYLHDGQRIVL